MNKIQFRERLNSISAEYSAETNSVLLSSFGYSAETPKFGVPASFRYFGLIFGSIVDAEKAEIAAETPNFGISAYFRFSAECSVSAEIRRKQATEYSVSVSAQKRRFGRSLDHYICPQSPLMFGGNMFQERSFPSTTTPACTES